MAGSATVSFVDALREAVQPLTGDAHAYDALLALIGDSPGVAS